MDRTTFLCDRSGIWAVQWLVSFSSEFIAVRVYDTDLAFVHDWSQSPRINKNVSLAINQDIESTELGVEHSLGATISSLSCDLYITASRRLPTIKDQHTIGGGSIHLRLYAATDNHDMEMTHQFHQCRSFQSKAAEVMRRVLSETRRICSQVLSLMQLVVLPPVAEGLRLKLADIQGREKNHLARLLSRVTRKSRMAYDYKQLCAFAASATERLPHVNMPTHGRSLVDREPFKADAPRMNGQKKVGFTQSAYNSGYRDFSVIVNGDSERRAASLSIYSRITPLEPESCIRTKAGHEQSSDILVDKARPRMFELDWRKVQEFNVETRIQVLTIRTYQYICMQM
ncbi:unnamed protein product [Fusarium venenatum]|uniref:Uncharacterized protein n=1 Tax=Fusarium venenatum TaxID=56646 RepID=A0A2L2TIU0_9HYPO|nr:uncharacterized protein FVRRES_00849 [Fusarium venenatum]CEI64337.1 unnamed protein product [Fusarium venenatum]